MKLLLDTHALIWTVDSALLHRLTTSARSAIEDRSNELLVSAASAWEVATKHRIGRLPEGERLVRQWSDIVGRLGARDLAVTVSHALRAGSLGVDHADPFDRILAAQAEIEGARLVTADRTMVDFGVDLLW